MKNIIVYAIAAVFILAATTLILTAGSPDKAVGKADIEACCDSEHAHAAAHEAEEACCDSEHAHAAVHEAEEACCDGEKDAALADHDACCGNCQG